MEMYVVTSLFLALLSGLSHGAGVLPDNLNGALGGSVTLTTTINPPDKPFLVVVWTFINATNRRTVILTSTSTDVVISPGYEDRITLFRSTASLELRNLDQNDNGEYRVSVVPVAGATMNGLTMLKLYKKISGAVITPSTVQPVEGNSTNMTCDAEGTISTRDWMKDGRPLTPSSDGAVTLHDSNRVLSFSAVKNTDNGEYSCRVSNPVSSQEATYNMMVNLSVSVEVEHTPPTHVVGLIVGLLVAIPLTIILVLLCRYRTSKDPCCVRPVQSQGTNQSSAADQRTNQSGAPDDLYSQLQHGDTSVYGVITPSDVYANVPRTAAAAVVFTNVHSAP